MGRPHSFSKRPLCLRGSCRPTPSVLFPPPRPVHRPLQSPHLVTRLCPPKQTTPIHPRSQTSHHLMAQDVPKATCKPPLSHHSIPSRSPLTGTTRQHRAPYMHFPWNESGRGREPKMAKASTSRSRTCPRLRPSFPPSRFHHAPKSRPESPR